jgi:hypothetical protein
MDKIQVDDLESQAKKIFIEQKLHVVTIITPLSIYWKDIITSISIIAPYGIHRFDKENQSYVCSLFNSAICSIDITLCDDTNTVQVNDEPVSEIIKLVEYICSEKNNIDSLKKKFFSWYQEWCSNELQANDFGHFRKLAKFKNYKEKYESQKEMIDYFVEIYKLVIYFAKIHQKYENKFVNSISDFIHYGPNSFYGVVESVKSIGITESLDKLFTPFGEIELSSCDNVNQKTKQSIKEKLNMQIANPGKYNYYVNNCIPCFSIMRNLKGTELEPFKFTGEYANLSFVKHFWKDNIDLIVLMTMQSIDQNGLEID